MTRPIVGPDVFGQVAGFERLGRAVRAEFLDEPLVVLHAAGISLRALIRNAEAPDEDTTFQPRLEIRGSTGAAGK
jgi:hypothetical protein